MMWEVKRKWGKDEDHHISDRDNNALTTGEHSPALLRHCKAPVAQHSNDRHQVTRLKLILERGKIGGQHSSEARSGRCLPTTAALLATPLAASEAKTHTDRSAPHPAPPLSLSHHYTLAGRRCLSYISYIDYSRRFSLLHKYFIYPSILRSQPSNRFL